MAFGAPRTNSPLTNAAQSPGTGLLASGSITVSADDLIVVHYAERATNFPTNVTFSATFTGGGAATSFSLLEQYRATNAALDLVWARVTSGGTLTGVQASHTTATNDAAIIVTVFEGPFAQAAVDKNISAASDVSSSYDCPASGTLAQPDELVMGFFVGSLSVGTAVASTSPATDCGQAASAAAGTTSSVSGHTNYRVVTSTSSVSNSFTYGGTNPAAGTVKTVTFRKLIPSLVFEPRPLQHILVR